MKIMPTTAPAACLIFVLAQSALASVRQANTPVMPMKVIKYCVRRLKIVVRKAMMHPVIKF